MGQNSEVYDSLGDTYWVQRVEACVRLLSPCRIVPLESHRRTLQYRRLEFIKA
jgi:hypothetical protein